MGIAKDAQREAEWVLDALWKQGAWNVPLPVDPVQIARDLGIDVYEAEMDDGVLAALVKEEGQDPTILLNETDSPNRQRFSCAHELGHYIRRREDEYEYVDRRDVLSSEGTDPDEIFANSFAAALLMPEDVVRDLYQPDSSIFRIAQRFSVSPEAMRYRLQTLGLE
jgi:Zn-dependent peptidase ImmA (M78 family)